MTVDVKQTINNQKIIADAVSQTFHDCLLAYLNAQGEIEKQKTFQDLSNAKVALDTCYRDQCYSLVMVCEHKNSTKH